jgi:hypothetical protein
LLNNILTKYPNRLNFLIFISLGLTVSFVDHVVVWGLYFLYSFGITFHFLKNFKQERLTVKRRFIADKSKNKILKLFYGVDSVLYIVSWFLIPVLTSVFLYLDFNNTQEIETVGRITIVMISSIVLAIYFKSVEKIVKTLDKVLNFEQFLVTCTGINLFFLISTHISFNYFTQNFIGEIPITIMITVVFSLFLLWISLRLFKLDPILLGASILVFGYFSFLLFQKNIISLELSFLMTTLGFVFMTAYQKILLKEMTGEIAFSYVVILVAVLLILFR